MTSEQFAYWLQGFSELNEGVPTEAQWAAIKDHLQEVFKRVTPIRTIGGGALLGNAQNAQLGNQGNCGIGEITRAVC